MLRRPWVVLNIQPQILLNMCALTEINNVKTNEDIACSRKHLRQNKQHRKCLLWPGASKWRIYYHNVGSVINYLQLSTKVAEWGTWSQSTTISYGNGVRAWRYSCSNLHYRCCSAVDCTTTAAICATAAVPNTTSAAIYTSASWLESCIYNSLDRLLLVVVRNVGNARLLESDLHTIMKSKTPAPKYQPIERMNRKENNKGEKGARSLCI